MSHQEEKNGRQEELDRFWEIDDLIPAGRAIHYPANTETTEIVLEPVEKERTSGGVPIPKREEPVRRYIPPHTAENTAPRKADEEYTPEHALLHRVRIYRMRSEYQYYEAFIRDAVRLYPIRGERCEPSPFFSYVPQYSQMTRSQLEWYLWWRENFRQGIRLDVDYSYLLLYAYELVNLSGRVDAAVIRDGLCRLWLEYRDLFHQLDSYLPEWICDCCLLHRLPPPDFEVSRQLSAAMSHCKLKEFYITSAGEDGYLRALLTFCCSYDYRKSKFYTEEHAALFDRAITGAVKAVSLHSEQEGKPFASAGLEESRILRDAYVGALCASRIKRRIEVEYCSFSRSHELKILITDVVKYTENRIRQALGIRSRLSVYALPTSVRSWIDEYLASVLPARERGALPQKEMSRPDYEKQYDTPHKPISFAAAEEIERRSWDTTRRLVEAFEEDGEREKSIRSEAPWGETENPLQEKALQPVPIAFSEENDGTLEQTDVWSPYRAFLRAVRKGDSAAQRAEAKAQGMLSEVLADRINELAADAFGDVLLEETDGGYAVIEDYAELLDQLINEKEAF